MDSLGTQQRPIQQHHRQLHTIFSSSECGSEPKMVSGTDRDYGSPSVHSAAVESAVVLAEVMEFHLGKFTFYSTQS